MDLVADDIMTAQVTTLGPDDALIDALKISQKQNIRHIPVVNDGGKLLGIVTQKCLVSKVMKLLSLYGSEDLPEREQQVAIREVMQVDMDTISADTDLGTLAQQFISHKHGCLPVVASDKRLLGLVTSYDFVKIVPTLLSQRY